MKRSLALLLLLTAVSVAGAAGYELAPHPRIFITAASLPGLAERSQGVLAAEYAAVKALADSAVTNGVERPGSRFRPPMGLVCAGVCYLVERQLGHECKQYVDVARKYWGDGTVLDLDGDGYFGWHGIVFDWVYDALTPSERKLYGDRLGKWLRFWSDTPEITLNNGGWLYNQTWGPAHLNTPNTRDGITPKLMVALALEGAGTAVQEDCKRFLDSWAARVPSECIPAFDEMGEVWSESMGHGGYGPIEVIPWSFEAWRTATGQDLFTACAPTSYLPGMTRWAVNLVVPFAEHTAWIDDNRADKLRDYAQVAPLLAARYHDPVANYICDQAWREKWNRLPWERFLFYDPSIRGKSPSQMGYPTAEWFKGAGHVYMRSAWDDPNAAWAFFGVGPKFEGHSRDDEGSFLLAKKGWLALRAGGQGHNDGDYYIGGSLAYNIVTIYDPEEKFRRTDPGSGEQDGIKNENDGGLIRWVYSSHQRDDRGKIVAYSHNDRYTYAAADISLGYSKSKATEVTRQFLFLRGKREFFVVFDRVEATRPDFPKIWFLHVPDEPKVDGREVPLVPQHVFSYDSVSVSTWLSDPAGEEGVLSTGKCRVFLKTLLPFRARITKRGGEGYSHWGHPYEPTAQYNHANKNSLRPPIVPWRLEVEAPQGNKRNYFLNVFELGDEADSQMSGVELVREQDALGAEIDAGGQKVRVLFSQTGPLTARIKIGEAAEETIEPLKTE